jgi:protein phosphatase
LPNLSFEAGAASDIGKVRERNEDSFLLADESGVFAVADGMGGHDAGDLASRTVVEELAQIAVPLSAAELVASCRARLHNADSRLKAIARQRGGLTIGTTAAVLLVHGRSCTCVWAGDSRIYRIRKGAITQMSVDHNQVQELLAQGGISLAQARLSPLRNIITRAVGVFDELEFETACDVVEPSDIFVICSDGLTAHVEDHEILKVATSNRPQPACNHLVRLTLDRGATDNVTVIIVRWDLPTGRRRPSR